MSLHEINANVSQPVEVILMLYLFRHNLEAATGSREELEREIGITLYHELGHALGFDEEGVEGLGLA